MSAADNIITASELSVGYRENGRLHKVAEGIDFSLSPGRLTTLMGSNGAGKSTLIKTICGVLRPISGEIFIGGRPIESYKKPELSSLMSVVLTERTPDGGLTVYEMVSMGRYPYTGFFGTLTQEDRKIIEESMEIVGISGMSGKKIAFLSDGERQKVMIAKSLAQQTPVIILDEPTAFLDVRSKIETVMTLRLLAKEKGKAVLMSSHDIELALRYSDDIWVLSDDGLSSGTTEEVICSGGIDPVIGNSERFRFDYDSGVFRTTNAGPSVSVSGEGNTYWVRNALERNGYVVNGSGSAAEVNVSADGNIYLKNENNVQSFGSVDGLIRYLDGLK